MKLNATLGRLVKGAMDLWVQMKAEGTTYADRLEVMDATVRRIWLFRREWKYLCEDCGDTGWEPATCTPQAPCGRPFTFPKQRTDDYTGRGHCVPGHAYVRPCFCAKGREMYAALHAGSVTAGPEDFAAAGRTRKMTRLGR